MPQPGLVFHGTALSFGRRGGQVDWIVVVFGCVPRDYSYRGCVRLSLMSGMLQKGVSEKMGQSFP